MAEIIVSTTYEQRKILYEVMRDHSDSIDYVNRWMTPEDLGKLAHMQLNLITACLAHMIHELNIMEVQEVMDHYPDMEYRLVPLEWRKVVQGRMHKKSELNGYEELKHKKKDYEILGEKIDSLPAHMRLPFIEWMDKKMGKVVMGMTVFQHWYEFDYLMNDSNDKSIPEKALAEAFNAGMHYQESKRLT